MHLLLDISTDQLNDIEESVKYYRRVLHYDSSNMEAIASLGANYFYSEQPELALRLYHPHAVESQIEIFI